MAEFLFVVDLEALAHVHLKYPTGLFWVRGDFAHALLVLIRGQPQDHVGTAQRPQPVRHRVAAYLALVLASVGIGRRCVPLAASRNVCASLLKGVAKRLGNVFEHAIVNHAQRTPLNKLVSHRE